MNPLAGMVGRLGAGAFGVGVSRAPGGELGFTARLLTADANRVLDGFERKTRTAVKRALNEAMRNAFAATVRATLAESGIKRRKALSEGNGKKGRIRWYPATDRKPEAALFVGLKSEPGLTLARTGAVGAPPAAATIAAANRHGKSKSGDKAAARAAAAAAYPNLRTRRGRPGSALFWAQMPSGHVGVFARRARQRLPVDEPYLAIREIAERHGQHHVNQQFRDTYPRALKRLMGI